ncbi:zinc metallopeptidase [Catonella morbi]|nr:zinc metallopeptidase [Catonella morbi]
MCRYYSYILIFIVIFISVIASNYLKSTYRKFGMISSNNRMTAEACAFSILSNAGITDVSIQRIEGELTDHYSPSEKVLRLSDSVYGSTSVAAIGVAARECGHAIQDEEGYVPLKLRTVFAPIANIVSTLSGILITAGLAFDFLGLARVGVLLFTFVVIFRLITLPVEIDASRRALIAIEENDLLRGSELEGAGKVLKAATLTYAVALFSSPL